MELGVAFEWVSLLVKFGMPAVVNAYQKIKASSGVEPTPEAIRGIMAGVEPPEKY